MISYSAMASVLETFSEADRPAIELANSDGYQKTDIAAGMSHVEGATEIDPERWRVTS
jgi:hypothetical protein